MSLLPALLPWALSGGAVLLVGSVVTMRRRRRHSALPEPDGLDTVADWPPEATRVLSSPERNARDLLRRAAPGMMLLAQVPLARFIRVPVDHSYPLWMQRVGSLNADLLLCDGTARVHAVIDVRASNEAVHSKRRHERMARVLREAGIQVYTWHEGALPDVQQVRNQLASLLSHSGAATTAPRNAEPAVVRTSRVSAAEVEALLAQGDLAHAREPQQEPVPSAYMDYMESAAR